MSGQNSTAQMNDWVSRVLGVDVAGGAPAAQAAAPAAGRPAVGTVALQKCRLAWDATRKSIRVKLKDVETAIVAEVTAHNEDPETEDAYDLGEVTGGLPRLYAMLDRYDERLIDKLDEALNAEGEARARLNAEAGALVRGYQATLAADEELARIDASGFAAPIRPVIEQSLSALGKML